MFIGDIKTASPFRDLFPMSDRLIKEIYWDMQKNGYDETKPIALWESHGAVVIDGHTRLRAANKAGLIQVPVVLKRFETEQEALEYAIKCQRNRRSLTDREITKCVDELDKRKPPGQRNDLAQGCARLGKSSTETGSMLGISGRKVEQVRTILDKGSEEVKEAVQTGNMSINSAYNQTVGTPKKPPPPKQNTPRQGTQESLELAAEEIASVEKIIDIINERLNKKQMRELIKRLVLGFSEKYSDEDGNVPPR
jgi:ParB family chromosome partitioning protein